MAFYPRNLLPTIGKMCSNEICNYDDVSLVMHFMLFVSLFCEFFFYNSTVETFLERIYLDA
jgi:hypothetical protein